MSDEDRPRRFGRRHADFEALAVAGESLGALRAELVLLREENARLKAAPHQSPDLTRLLDRARSLPTARVDDDCLADETTRVLIEGLVIRESLLEICRQMERAMILFQGRLRALGGEQPETMLRPPQDARTGHWFEPPASESDGDTAA